jgi:hypothetical protein
MYGFVCALGCLSALAYGGGCRSSSPPRGNKEAASAEGAYDLTYPIPLETVLRTEEAVFYALLQAGGTLEGAGIIIAVRPATLALRFSFGSHGETLLLRLTTECREEVGKVTTRLFSLYGGATNEEEFMSAVSRKGRCGFRILRGLI